jgi:hypothetical protein
MARKDFFYCCMFSTTLLLTVTLGTISIWGGTYLVGWEAWEASTLYTKVSVIGVGVITLVMLTVSVGFLVFLCRRREKRRQKDKEFVPLVGAGADADVKSNGEF